jgi:hypothetical protein
MPKVLRKLRINTIGMVHKGANPGSRVALCKAGTMTPEELQAMLDKLNAELSDEGKQALAAVLEAAKAPAPVPKADDDPEPMPPKADDDPEPMPPKADDEDEDKVMSVGKAESEALAKARADAGAARAEVEKANAELATLREAEEVREYVTKAQTEMATLPGVKPAELGVMLRKVHKDLGDEAYGSLCGILASASRAIGKSMLLKSVGSDRSDGDGKNSMTRLEARVAEIRKTDNSLTREQALYKAAQADPGLFRAAALED